MSCQWHISCLSVVCRVGNITGFVLPPKISPSCIRESRATALHLKVFHASNFTPKSYLHVLTFIFTSYFREPKSRILQFSGPLEFRIENPPPPAFSTAVSCGKLHHNFPLVSIWQRLFPMTRVNPQ